MPDIASIRRRAALLYRGRQLPPDSIDTGAYESFHILLMNVLLWVCVEECVVIPLFAARKLAAAILVFIVGVIALVSLSRLRRRKLRAAAFLFLSTMWCIAGFMFLLSGGVRGPAPVMLLVVLIEVTWLLGRTAAFAFAGATVTLLFVDALMAQLGHSPPAYFPGPPLALWATEALVIIQAVGPVLNIVEVLKKQVSALRDSEERFRSISDASFEGIMIHDRGVILDANLAFARLFGYERLEDLIGRNGPDLLLTPESRARVQRRMELQETGIIELTGIRKDGALITAETETRLVKHFGRDARIVAWRDISERRRAELEKEELEARLNQAHKMESIGRLAGGIAHDFNNLLTVINGYSDMLVRQIDNPGRKYAEEILLAGGTAASLTSQLLAFSRSDVTPPERVFVNQLVKESGDMLERLVGEHIAVRTWLHASPDAVSANPNQLRQCLMNLAVNGRDAMPHGGHLSIHTDNVDIAPHELQPGSSGTPGPYIRLSVRDTGIGMDEETRRRIFEPFFTTKPPHQGVGLGLSTVYGIVNRWDGFLTVTSEPGKGSAFCIYLPLNITPHAPGITTQPEPGPLAVPSETVLVVEVQDIVRKVVAEFLRTAGYHVLEAGNGLDALARIESSPTDIHLMMTDVMMPGMRGTELAARARILRPSLKVLLMTGYADDPVGTADMPHGVDEVIMKPFSSEALEARMRELLHR